MTNLIQMETEVANKSLKFAVENNNLDLLKWIFVRGQPTNIEECLKLATEKGFSDLRAALTPILIAALTPVKPVEEPPKKVVEEQPAKPVEEPPKKVVEEPPQKKTRPLVINPVDKSSQLMKMIKDRDTVTILSQLSQGEISLEEINHKNSKGWSALMTLTQNFRHDILYGRVMKSLIELGAEVNSGNDAGSTALMYACRYSGNYSADEAVEMLLKHPKIEINVQDESGMTALMYACDNGETTTFKTVEMLLNHPKIDVSLMNKAGMNALLIIGSNFNFNRSFEINIFHKKVVELFFQRKDLNLKQATPDKCTAFGRIYGNCPEEYKDAITELFFKYPGFGITFNFSLPIQDLDKARNILRFLQCQGIGSYIK